MIELDITTAVALYLCLTVITLLLLELYLDRGTKSKQYASEKKSIWQCEVCAFTYIDSQHDVISKCTQCGSFNKRKGNTL